jgi:sulfonate transport system permease protein
VLSGLVPANLLPAPSEIAGTISDLAQSNLASQVGASVARLATGFFLEGAVKEYTSVQCKVC